MLGHCASTGDGDKRRTTTTRPESNARSPRENRPPKRDRQSQPMNAADSVRLLMVVHLYSRNDDGYRGKEGMEVVNYFFAVEGSGPF